MSDGQNALVTARSGRLPFLDGLRAVASLAVVYYHFGPHISPLLFRIPRHGEEGVTLFFVLSGFLISSILLSARDSPRYFQTFYIRRACRIFPLYYLTLAGYLLIVAIGPAAVLSWTLFSPRLATWTYFLYLQNFAMTVAGSYGAVWMAGSWSLAIEEQFYFTLPALVRFFSEKAMWRWAWAGLLAPTFLRIAVQKLHLMTGMGERVLLVTAMDSLATGLLTALMMRDAAIAKWLKERSGMHGWLTAAGLVAWFFYPAIVSDPRYYPAENLVTSLASGMVLLHTLIRPDGHVANVLSLGWMRTLGNLAYSTYLFHPILLHFAFHMMRGKEPSLLGVADLPPILAAAAGTFALCYASWHWLETPLIAIGHRWSYTPRAQLETLPGAPVSGAEST